MRCLTASSDYSRSPTCRSQSRDDTDVAGQSTRWGSVVNRGLCRHDAEIVRRLQRAGAIVIGKTNVPELTLWPSTASEAFGTTRNPWDATRTPGGSSGSSAVAVSTGMAAIGLGSDGGGSIRYPAGLTGLVRAETTKRSCACGRRTRIRVARPRRPWPPHPFGARCRMLPRHRLRCAGVHDLSRRPRGAVVATPDCRLDQPDSVARLGRAFPDRSFRRALRRQAQVADSINRVFDSADVVLTPLCEASAPLIDDCPTRGGCDRFEQRTPQPGSYPGT